MSRLITIERTALRKVLRSGRSEMSRLGLVAAARNQARRLDFQLSSDDRVGNLLAVLAAHTKAGGSILELGTGTGAGTAWIVTGLGSRTDVSLVTVESDPTRARAARALPWPEFVELIECDAIDFLNTGRQFDLIFADAQGGKWQRLDLTVAALAENGLLFVDDMDLALCVDAEDRRNTQRVRRALLGDQLLQVVDIGWATGVMLCAKSAPRARQQTNFRLRTTEFRA